MKREPAGLGFQQDLEITIRGPVDVLPEQMRLWHRVVEAKRSALEWQVKLAITSTDIKSWSF